MLETIRKIIDGKYCPKCSSHQLYKLSDNRFKCSECLYKYSPCKIAKDLKLLHYFSLEIPARKAAKDLGYSYNMVRNHYMDYRLEIFDYLSNEFRKLSGEIECDESYFGGKKKGPRGRGAREKVKVFGMLECQGSIFTAIVDNVSAETLMNEIRSHAEKGSVFYTDKFKSYKSLKFYGKHRTVDHGKEFGKGRKHINGLEGFWSFAKERLLKYHGVSKSYFHL
ncbi:IS1595 family transposase [Caldithrix abyssi]|nr:IS1595 family transposase [Caldithrix abyssi]